MKQVQIINNILIAVLMIALAVGMVYAYIEGSKGTKEYNRHMCAVYGYQEDCETPL